MVKLIAILLLLCFDNVFGAQTWKDSKDGFAASVTVSPSTLSVLDTLIVEIHLKAPPGYQPDINRIRENLLDDAGFDPAPFTISTETLKGRWDLKYVLNPQVGGTHQITPRDIRFTSEKGVLGAVLISDIFNVEVFPVQVDLAFEGTPSPLISLARPDPVELSQVNLEKWVDDKITVKKSTADVRKIKGIRQRAIESFLYSIIFALLIGFIILIPRQSKR